MVSVDKIQRGAAKYVDAELMPKMQGKDKWLITSMATLYLAKLPNILSAVKDVPAIKILGIVGDDLSVDIDALAASIRPAARQGEMMLQIPFGGSIRFSEADIDALHRFIAQA